MEVESNMEDLGNDRNVDELDNELNEEDMESEDDDIYFDTVNGDNVSVDETACGVDVEGPDLIRAPFWPHT